MASSQRLAATLSNAEYLKKYVGGSSSSSTDATDKKLKKKVKKKEINGAKVIKSQGLKILDEDEAAIARKPFEDEEEDYRPVIVAQTNQNKAPVIPKTPYIKIEDGSGWVTVDAPSSTQPKIEKEDESPPRRARISPDESPDLSLPRNKSRDSDSSPPRTKSRDIDSSPPRKRSRDEDSSPPRHKNADLSPPRGSRTPDLSPPRRESRDRDSSPRRREQDLPPPSRMPTKDVPPPTRLASGAIAGLQHASDVKKQAEDVINRQKAKFAGVDPSLMGKDAQTVYRDRRGRKLEGLEAFTRQKEGKFTSEEEQNMEWGKGKVQYQQKLDKQKEIEEEKNKPFARTRDDTDLNDMLKERDRWGDPMLGLIKKKPKSTTQPRYQGPAGPPNRFSIEPGFRWDGIDRGNGFEQQLFALQSKRVALKDEAYLWSVEDM